MVPRKKLRIGDLLVEHKVISEAQLQKTLGDQKRSGRKLGKVLIENGFISEDQLLEFLSRQLGLPFVDLKHFKFQPHTVRIIPETFARRYRAVALSEEGDGSLLVGMADPTDIFGYDELCRLLKRHVKQAVVRERDLLTTIDLVYRRTEEIFTLAEELGEELQETDFDLAELVRAEDVANAPVVKLLQSMFEDAVQVGASDIHIEPDESVLRIRQRIDGVLHEQVMKEKRIASALVSRLKLMGGLNISERRVPQDGRFNIRVRDRNIDVRLSSMPIHHGESVVMRLLDHSQGLLDLDRLGMPPELLNRLRQLIHRPHGMVLVTGPTGSGKTTTLYSALSELNEPAKKIITAEDPVEYRLPRVSQVQVNPKLGLDFAAVLRAALRQDPDIVLVGEIRDQETAEIALRASITGHLVLSTLHTNDAIASANRLIDMGAEGYMVATALRAVLAQRLVRRICASCKEPHEPDLHQTAWLYAALGAEADTARFMRGAGCPHCNGTGYNGRVGVFELLEMDEPLADALRREDTADFARLARQRRGFRTFARHALDYAMEGVTTVEEVLRVSGDIEDGFDAVPTPASGAEAG